MLDDLFTPFNGPFYIGIFSLLRAKLTSTPYRNRQLALENGVISKGRAEFERG